MSSPEVRQSSSASQHIPSTEKAQREWQLRFGGAGGGGGGGSASSSPAGSGSAPAGSDAAARTILAAMTPPVSAGSLQQNGDCFGEDVHRNGSGLRTFS